MNIKRIIVATALAAVSFAAQAVPVAYEFSGEITGGAGPFSAGTELTASFDYDASIGAFGTDIDGAVIAPPFANYGLFSIYLGAVTNFVASVDGASFGSDAAATFVGDGSGDPLSGIFVNANGGAPGWTGLSLLGFELLSYTMSTVGASDMLSDQSLPGTLPYYEDVPFGTNTGLNMVFIDTAGARHVQTIWGNAGGNVSLGAVAVPEPTTAVLLALGLLMIALRRKRVLARIDR